MKTISLTIDGQKVSAREGEVLLWVALDNGFYIPHLCALKERVHPFAGCRLCFVEIEGYAEPVTACTETVRAGMVVRTKTETIRELQRTAFELILSAHHLDCGHCGKNKKCELQKIAKNLTLKLNAGTLLTIRRDIPRDDSHPLFIYDPDKCVLCGKCVWLCSEHHKTGVFNFARRGFDMMVTTFGSSLLSADDCEQCRQCVDVCPVGALLLKNEKPVVEDHNA